MAVGLFWLLADGNSSLNVIPGCERYSPHRHRAAALRRVCFSGNSLGSLRAVTCRFSQRHCRTITLQDGTQGAFGVEEIKLSEFTLEPLAVEFGQLGCNLIISEIITNPSSLAFFLILSTCFITPLLFLPPPPHPPSCRCFISNYPLLGQSNLDQQGDK